MNDGGLFMRILSYTQMLTSIDCFPYPYQYDPTEKGMEGTFLLETDTVPEC